ncbi:MAG TPA: hypothetical protein PLL21_03530 [Sedimentibacter sp.]|nr:hypothetical protein [Sedimentibacter sp.]
MENSLKITGAPSLEELHRSPAYPPEDRLKKGPIAIIECIEENIGFLLYEYKKNQQNVQLIP